MIHTVAVRVYYEDTDAGGVVYHANYLRFAERARTEWLRELGLGHGDLRRRFGLLFMVRRCSADFRRPALLDESLNIDTQLIEMTGARVRLRQLVRRGRELLVAIDVELALVSLDGRPARVPQEIRSAIAEAARVALHA
jgi:acyl-CoA thioester hydrolase